MLQLDCGGASDYKTYGIPVTADFLSFIERETGYVRAESTGKTDIGRLCRDICRVNLSVGYYNERHPEETFVVAERERTLSITRRRGWKREPSLSRERPGDGARALPLPLLRFTHFVLLKKVDSKKLSQNN